MTESKRVQRAADRDLAEQEEQQVQSESELESESESENQSGSEAESESEVEAEVQSNPGNLPRSSSFDMFFRVLPPVAEESSTRLDNASNVPIQCPICLDNITEKRDLVIAFCRGGHKFHSHCLKPWMDVKIECPTCREQYIINGFDSSLGFDRIF